jgi:hypothetical protein
MRLVLTEILPEKVPVQGRRANMALIYEVKDKVRIGDIMT